MGLIYLDSCLLIYLVEMHPVWGQKVAAATTATAGTLFAISPLVKCECLVGPIRRGDLVSQRNYTDLFAALVPLELPEAVYLRAAALRARFSLKTPDALHLACAGHHGCDSLWTNDDRLAQASEGFARGILDR